MDLKSFLAAFKLNDLSLHTCRDALGQFTTTFSDHVAGHITLFFSQVPVFRSAAFAKN